MLVKKCCKNSSKDSSQNFKYVDEYFHLQELDNNLLCTELNTTPHGLPDDLVEYHKTRYGKNIVKINKKKIFFKQLLHAIINPFNILLIILSILTYCVSKDNVNGTIILVMVVLSTITSFIQEYRSSKAVTKLQEMITRDILIERPKKQFNGSDVTKLDIIVRNNKCFSIDAIKNNISDTIIEIDDIKPLGDMQYYENRFKINVDELVRGDLVVLHVGDIIPADLCLIESKNLCINQSSMTGESMPVEKDATVIVHVADDLFSCKKLCFHGTNVTNGSGKGIVVQTGENTLFGNLSSNLLNTKPKSSFDKGIVRYVVMMVIFMIVLGLATLLINALIKKSWTDALQFALAVAVGLTPEMLPMIITVNLAKGAFKLSKKKMITKRLSAVQNLGAIDILCTDKTGTLTEDNIVLSNYTNIHGNIDKFVLELSCINSVLQTGLDGPIDMAIINACNYNEIKNQYIKQLIN